MNRESKLFIWVAALSLSATGALADTSAKELLVRFNPSQSNRSADLRSLAATLSRTTGAADVVNASERVVKLTFASESEAQAAKAELLASGAVASVSANRYYHPMIHYAFKERDESNRSWTSFVAPLLPPAPTLPGVNPAPVSFMPGVDPMESKDWAMNSIRMPSFGEVQAMNKSEVVSAVIDTGIDYNHEDLSGALWRKAGSGEVGFDFAHNIDKPYDVVKFDLAGCAADFLCLIGVTQNQYLVNPGHGTHCAGHVGAVANNSLGIRGIGAGATKVMGIKFFYDFGEQNAGQGDDAAAVKAIDYAIANGVKVISASWGGESDPAEAEASELKQALIRAKNAGILFVVAAGNGDHTTGIGFDNDKAAKPVYPAKFELDNVLTVAATDVNDKLGTFSNFGAKSVHIGAPGVKILSTVVGGSYADTIGSLSMNGQTQDVNWDGTSMATPIVAGAASLLWSVHPDWTYLQVKERLMQTSRKVPALTGKVASGGILDVRAALGI